MPVEVIYPDEPSQGNSAFAVTARRKSDGKFWDNNSTVSWQTSPTFANKKLALSEGSSEYLGKYSATFAAGMGDAGIVEIYVHDAAGTRILEVNEIIVLNSEEVLDSDLLIVGNVNDAGAAATDFNGSANLSSSDDFYNQMYLVFTSGALRGVPAKITDYTGSSKNLAFGTNFPMAPANGDKFKIIGHG